MLSFRFAFPATAFVEYIVCDDESGDGDNGGTRRQEAIWQPA